MVLENVREMWTEVSQANPSCILSHDFYFFRFLPMSYLAHDCFALLQIPKTGKGKKKALPVNKDRFISKMFLRGDSVIIVLRNPK